MSLREEKGYPKPIIPFEDREKWALNTLADSLEKILIEFDELEQEKSGIVSSKELGTNCWSSFRFIRRGLRCAER